MTYKEWKRQKALQKELLNTTDNTKIEMSRVGSFEFGQRVPIDKKCLTRIVIRRNLDVYKEEWHSLTGKEWIDSDEDAKGF